MPRFVGRPVIIEAHQWTGEPLPGDFQVAFRGRTQDGRMMISAADGPQEIRFNDWIVRGPSGAFRVWRDADFEAHFEPQSMFAGSFPKSRQKEKV